MNSLKTSDFYFDLPEELIAQDPLEDRSSSRLLVLQKEDGRKEHKIFRDVPQPHTATYTLQLKDYTKKEPMSNIYEDFFLQWFSAEKPTSNRTNSPCFFMT